MTERISQKLYDISQVMYNILVELKGISEHIYHIGHRSDPITESIEWMRENIDDFHNEIYVQIYVQTPRGHKIYECKSENLLSNEGEYIIMNNDKDKKIEMINKDCVYKIILDMIDE